MSVYEDSMSDEEDSAGSLVDWIADDDEDVRSDGVATALTSVSRSNIIADRQPNKYGLRRSTRKRKPVNRYIDPEFSKIFFEKDDPRAYFHAKFPKTVDTDDSEYVPSTDVESESESTTVSETTPSSAKQSAKNASKRKASARSSQKSLSKPAKSTNTRSRKRRLARTS